mmetsp:Transcript_43342/g.55676  ORF Transcript_43342/g.55676 Transcript_43342/m.55676 type:complete len:383 (-) Transcript_43342:112-1260(-)
MFGVASMGGNNLTELLESKPEEVQSKSVLMQTAMAKIIEFLRSNREKGFSAKELELKINVILDKDLAFALQQHRKIRTDEFGYWFRSENNHLTDQISVLQEINRRPEIYGRAGIPLANLSDCYKDVMIDIRSMVRSGDVIAIENKVITEKSTATFFPRGPIFGTVLEEPNTSLISPSSFFPSSSSPHLLDASMEEVSTNCNVTKDILPGEAVFVFQGQSSSSNTPTPSSSSSSLSSSSSSSTVLGEVSRVSSSRIGGKELAEDSISASESFERVYSVTLDKKLGSHLKSQVQWTRELSDKKLPLDSVNCPSGPISLVRFGCSSDLRLLWKESGSKLSKDNETLKRLLNIKEQPRKVPKRLAPKQKKRAWRSAKSTTNAHLDR